LEEEVAFLGEKRRNEMRERQAERAREREVELLNIKQQQAQLVHKQSTRAKWGSSMNTNAINS